ncbi:MAG: hypothetical protein AB1424_01160 [Thermodesulfobacteriota bacterium]
MNFTRALEVLISRGHSLENLLHEYPIDLVLNLHRAALENRKTELKGKVLGLSIAVMNALDTALIGGKGRVLETWLKAMDAPGDAGGEDRLHRHSTLSAGALAFFGGRPVVRKPDKD